MEITSKKLDELIQIKKDLDTVERSIRSLNYDKAYVTVNGIRGRINSARLRNLLILEEAELRKEAARIVKSVG